MKTNKDFRRRLRMKALMMIAMAILTLTLTHSTARAETWVATAYCSCFSCCGKTDGITASGHKVKPNHTIALNWLPFHTKVSIDGKIYEVEDRGAKSEFGSKTNHKKRVDIYFASHREALRFGRKKVDVKILED